MKCVRWCVYCFWQIHKNGLSYCELNKHNKFFLMIHLKHGKLILRKHPNWACGAPLFLCTFIHNWFWYIPLDCAFNLNSSIPLAIEEFWSWQTIMSYRLLKRLSSHPISFNLWCLCNEIHWISFFHFDVLWHLITVT